MNLFRVSKVNLVYTRKVRLKDLPTVKSSDVAYTIFLHHWSEQLDFIEEAYLLLLNRSLKPLGMMHLSLGGVTGAVIDAKVIFTAALLARATGFILAHNHPSGSLIASQADIKLTERLAKGAKLLDLKMQDHMIITKDGYLSFADEGML